MKRCDYDGIFYRVFCITLLGIALVFTLILTNVFLDIDGLLADKEKDRSRNIAESSAMSQTQDKYDFEILYQPQDKNENMNIDTSQEESNKEYDEYTKAYSIPEVQSQKEIIITSLNEIGNSQMDQSNEQQDDNQNLKPVSDPFEIKKEIKKYKHWNINLVHPPHIKQNNQESFESNIAMENEIRSKSDTIDDFITLTQNNKHSHKSYVKSDKIENEMRTRSENEDNFASQIREAEQSNEGFEQSDLKFENEMTTKYDIEDDYYDSPVQETKGSLKQSEQLEDNFKNEKTTTSVIEGNYMSHSEYVQDVKASQTNDNLKRPKSETDDFNMNQSHDIKDNIKKVNHDDDNFGNGFTVRLESDDYNLAKLHDVKNNIEDAIQPNDKPVSEIITISEDRNMSLPQAIKENGEDYLQTDGYPENVDYNNMSQQQDVMENNNESEYNITRSQSYDTPLTYDIIDTDDENLEYGTINTTEEKDYVMFEPQYITRNIKVPFQSEFEITTKSDDYNITQSQDINDNYKYTVETNGNLEYESTTLSEKKDNDEPNSLKENKNLHFRDIELENETTTAEIQDQYRSDENKELFAENNKLAFDKYEPYRYRRSIDTPNPKIHMANPKIKEILNNRLSTLLEELDAEESQTTGAKDKQKKQVHAKPIEVFNVKNEKEDKEKMGTEEREVLHLAMHNILLQGIIGHMDLNDVYKKVNNLVKGFDQENTDMPTRRTMNSNDNTKDVGKPKTKAEDSQELSENPQALFSVESKFFDELVKCEDLQKQVSDAAASKTGFNRRSATKRTDEKEPKMLIKTIIDIRTLNKNDKHNDSKSHVNTNNIKGLIKLIYNGKSVNFTRMEDGDIVNNNINVEPDVNAKFNNEKTKTDLVLNDEGNIVDNFLDKALALYLKKYPRLEAKFTNKRPKRSVVKVHKHNNTEKPKEKTENDEEELYVEIETHIDSKGANSEKKKKIVKEIIDKIQKALRANIDSLQKGNMYKNSQMLQIKKRLQNPLKLNEKNLLKNKMVLPIETIVLRESAPISKAVKLDEPLPKVYDKSGEIWHKAYTGSNFLSKAKSINSGEMGLVDLDYNQVSKGNGIPQRLQQPLNKNNLEEIIDDSNYYNLGNLKFYVKDVDDTEFSIGFNQYVGAAPDPESIRLFTGLQHLINVYHQNYDNKNDANSDRNNSSAEAGHEVIKRDINYANRFASIFDNVPPTDYHSKEYKVAFDNRYLPYDSYSETIDDGRKKVSFSIEKESENNKINSDGSQKEDDHYSSPIVIGKKQQYKESLQQPYKESLPFLIDENLFNKQLKPSEIFGLANLLKRKRRSPTVKVKKYSNLNTRGKSRLNTYLNTNRKVKRIVKNKNRRTKRQVDKIRIIATDNLPHISRHSDENYYVVSDENMFADRAVVREVEMPEQEQAEPQEEEHNEFVIPHHYSHQLSPYNIFNAHSRHNTLMSKYPHLFLEEIARSKEEDNPKFYSNLMDSYADYQKNSDPTPPPSAVVTPFSAAEAPYTSVDVYDGTNNRPNYKLTVKIIPKNQTDNPSGFKVVHTSINKTINRNGLTFLSQVNVSELSKYEHTKGDQKNHFGASIQTGEPAQIKQNFTQQTTTTEDTQQPVKINMEPVGMFPLVRHIKEQQEQMKILLKQHKDRIDEQLDNLKKEKNNLDSMIMRGLSETTTGIPPEPKKVETIDVLLPLNPPQVLHLNKEEAGQLISNALMKLHDTPNLNDISVKITTPAPPTTTTATTTTQTTTSPTTTATQSTTTQSTSTQSATTQTTTTQATTTRTMTTIHPQLRIQRKLADPEKLKILKTIQRNENLTNSILYKIDRNTNLLQHFLQKLTDTLQPPKQKPEYSSYPDTRFSQSKDWRTGFHEPFFSQMPNMEVNKNATHVSIPFVYAYQQPYPLPTAVNNPVASVVYQGHIHTNAFNNNIAKNNAGGKKLPDKREANRTKFFIDDLESGFKVVPVPTRKHPYDMQRIKNKIDLIKNL